MKFLTIMFKNQVYNLCLTQCISITEPNQSILYNEITAVNGHYVGYTNSTCGEMESNSVVMHVVKCGRTQGKRCNGSLEIIA
jgi:hypothetical protein